MAPPPSLTELISTVHQDAPSDDPLDLLATASHTAAEMSTLTDSVLDHFVLGARRDGRSWTEISGVLGVSKQAAHKRFAPPTVGLDRFTPRAVHVLEAAGEVARRLGHTYIGTEHLLLAQYREPQSVAAVILARHDVEEAAVEEKILARTPAGSGEPVGNRPPFTPRGFQVISGALDEAVSLGHNYIGTEHLLLALFRDPESMAAQLLAEFGLDADAVRAEVAALLGDLRDAFGQP